MLAGLQGSGKTTLAGKLGLWLKSQGHAPAAGRRPTCSVLTPSTQLQVVGQQAGVEVFAPEPGNGVGDPVAVARDAIDVGPPRSSTTWSSSTPPAGSASTRS